MRAKCWDEETKTKLVERVRENQTGLQNKEYKLSHVRIVFLLTLLMKMLTSRLPRPSLRSRRLLPIPPSSCSSSPKSQTAYAPVAIAPSPTSVSPRLTFSPPRPL